MKKFLATILALVMVLSLVACGDSGTTESKEAAENTPSPQRASRPWRLTVTRPA